MQDHRNLSGPDHSPGPGGRDHGREYTGLVSGADHGRRFYRTDPHSPLCKSGLQDKTGRGDSVGGKPGKGIKKKNNDLLLSKKENFDNDKCPVTIENGKGIKITLGNCCTPIPGDEIIGYVTKGNGVTVHRKGCPNIANEKSRLIDVHWKEKRGDDSYPVDLSIECNDRNNLMADILSALAGARIKCTEISGKLHSENFTCTISAQIYVKDINELNKAFQLLKNVKDVYEIKRVIH